MWHLMYLYNLKAFRSKDYVEERDGNSDLGSIKIIKMSPWNRALFNKYNMQSECEWSVAI